MFPTQTANILTVQYVPRLGTNCVTSYQILSAYQALGPKRLSPYVTWTTGNERQIKYIGYLPNIDPAVCRNKPIRYKQDSMTKAMVYCNE